MSGRSLHRHGDRARRRRYRRVALGSLALLAIVTVAVFAKRNPFAHPFHITAVFSSAAQLTKGSQVRIAGIQVGQVQGIARGPHNTALVTMNIGQEGLPIHADTTLAVKPRLILEGNAYIDLNPGTPTAPELRDGATIAASHTAISVQLDQVLDVLSTPVRGALQTTVAQLASGLGGTPPGYASLRQAVRELDGALGPVGTVAQAAGGTNPGDLHRAIDSTGQATAQLARSPAALAGLVSDYNRVLAALAAEDEPLAAAIDGLDEVLKVAPGPLRDLDAALPTLTAFGNELRPVLHAAPPNLGDATRLLRQIALAVKSDELPALLAELAPVLSRLPALEIRLGTLFTYSTPVTDCISTHVVPTLQTKLKDGVNTTGDPVYLDLMHLFTGLTSFSSAVDANGGTVRLGITTGDRIIDTIFPGLGQVVGRIPGADGVRPVWLGYATSPPFRPDQPCAGQPLPNLNTPAASGPLPQEAGGAGR